MIDPVVFLRAFLRAPGAVGAIAPSSAALARSLVGSAGIEAGHRVVELGAGTGPMTRELVKRHAGVPLLVLEPDEALAARCREAAPGAEVVSAYAQELPALLAERGWPAADRIVSSLPFASFAPALQDTVFDAIDAVLADDGRFVTFTYAHSPLLPAGRRARVLLEDRFAEVHTTPITWCNLPPAFVYVCGRSATSGR